MNTRIEWWETRDGRRAWVAVEMVGTEGHCPGQYRGIGGGIYIVSWCLVDGVWRYTRHETGDLDLVKHLPNCTGWDWEPEPEPEPQYRKPTDADIGREIEVYFWGDVGTWEKRKLLHVMPFEPRFLVLRADGLSWHA